MKNFRAFLALTFILFALVVSLPAQNVSSQETTKVHTTDSVLQKKHSPKLAIALSAVVPGAGQIYNKKAWKLPIVYGCLGVSCYFIYDFATQMKMYRDEYRCRMLGDHISWNPELSQYEDATILSLKQTYMRYMEIAIAATGVFYLLNIIDAAVDAHLYYFDITDDLSMRVAPKFGVASPCGGSYSGVSIALKWK